MTQRVRLSSPRYAWIDTLFALPEAVGDGLFGMKGTLITSEALADHFCVLVDEDGHVKLDFLLAN